uniref:terminase gpA endonuclease subunit n=1 Tax=uncultured Allisonella sp. TaxID=339338 RepID=UPI002804A11C|nr:terminase gpA endonuclease subunit [uncultured Allisonella sp.]
MTVSQWADNYRILSREESPNAGHWNTDNTPYLRAIMDTFTDKTTQIVTFLKPSQVGATECAINICGYTIDRSPCRIFYVMPDEDLAKDFSVDRLQKALSHTPSIARKLGKADKSKALAIRFEGGFIRLTGANSPAKLASWAIPRVIMDEVDKYPKWAGREANPISLVKERTKNWSWRKIMVMSTPTTEYGYVYKSFVASEIHYDYQVPCPECMKYQVLDFKNLKFPTEINERRLASETYYECPYCKAHIKDKHKMTMLRRGKWVSRELLDYAPKTVGFKLNTLYSPWVRWGEVAMEFLKSKDDPSALMNFVNSWLGEPFKSKASYVKAKTVLQHKTHLKAGICPKDTLLLTAGVDVQKGYFYWVIRAWGVKMKSSKIANGTAVRFEDLMFQLNQYFPVEGSNNKLQVTLIAIDTGYRTTEIYDYCYDYYPLIIPVKGLKSLKTGYFRRVSLDNMKNKTMYNRLPVDMKLYEVDTNKYKDMIMYRLNKEVGSDGSWAVDADTDQEYAEMITAEQKVPDENGNEVWKQIGARPNHYLDCEVYAYLAGDVMGIRTMQAPLEEPSYEENGNSSGYSAGVYKPFG